MNIYLYIDVYMLNNNIRALTILCISSVKECVLLDKSHVMGDIQNIHGGKV